MQLHVYDDASARFVCLYLEIDQVIGEIELVYETGCKVFLTSRYVLLIRHPVWTIRMVRCLHTCR